MNFTATPAERAEALRAFARSGQRCWRCRRRTCVQEAWALMHPKQAVVLCPSCFTDVEGTMRDVRARLEGAA